MRKFFSIFAALTLSVGLWAANSFITFTSTSNFDLTTDAFLDANDQVLSFTIDYDESIHAGTIIVNGKLVKIAYQAFYYDCAALTSITLPEGLTSIGELSFYGCENLTTVNLPASLTTIDNHAFDNCTSLTSVNFAAGSQLTTIGEYAFNNCAALATITIPASVTEIMEVAFRFCSSLTDVYVAWTTMLPTLGDEVFIYDPVITATLHVPAGSLALYQNADQWKDFGSIYDVLATKDDAIAAVNAEIEETDNDNVKAIATDATTAINAATTVAEINALKNLAIANIASAKAAYGEAYTAGETAGDAAGYQRAQDELPTTGDCGPTVIITKGDKTLKLYNVDGVEYKITECTEE